MTPTYRRLRDIPYHFNPLFATETSLIDLLPHQVAAVYGAPPTPADPDGRPGMLDMPRLRFLLADDAGGGASVVNEPEGVVDERGTRGW